jgi:hypothetical protein
MLPETFVRVYGDVAKIWPGADKALMMRRVEVRLVEVLVPLVLLYQKSRGRPADHDVHFFGTWRELRGFWTVHENCECAMTLANVG